MAWSRAPPAWRSNGRASWIGAVVVEVADGHAEQREAAVLDHRHAPTRAGRGRRRAPARSRPSAPAVVCERVARVKSSKRKRSVTVRPTRSALRMPAGHAVDDADEHGVELVGACGAAGRARSASRSSAGAACAARGAGPGGWRGRRGGGRRGRRGSSTSGPSPTRAMSPTVSMPRACSLAAVLAPTPHTRSTGSGWRNADSPSGGTSSSPSGLADGAGDLGEELRAGDADGDRQPDPLAHVGAQPGGDLDRRAGDAAQPADVEERLVDRDALDERRRVVEHGEHGPAGVGVGLEAGRHDDGAAGTAAAPGRRPSPCARRTPWPRSWRPARRRRRR